MRGIERNCGVRHKFGCQFFVVAINEQMSYRNHKQTLQQRQRDEGSPWVLGCGVTKQRGGVGYGECAAEGGAWGRPDGAVEHGLSEAGVHAAQRVLLVTALKKQ